MDERRVRRSTDRETAAHLYLDAAATRGAYAALAVVDTNGLLIAGASKGPDVEAVAAVAPLAAQGHPPPSDGLLGLVTRGAPLRVWHLRLADEPCYLAAVGGDPTAPSQAEATLNRILF